MKKEIPKSYNPVDYEDKIYQQWEDSGYFNPDKCIKDKIIKENAKSYTISMPPPNRTGVLHMGHAAMLVIEDILIRYHRMKGERTLWLPGSDHAAIATQTKVEKIIKEEGANRHEMGREKFLARVVQFAQESHDTIVNQVKKMGSSCDWSREAYTLDETRNKAVRSVFKLMYDDGLIYRGDRVVNWCPRCHSTLADDEVEYESQKAKLYTFKYDKDFPFTIATTRPETKIGDTAVAVNPKDKRYKKYIGKVFKVNFVGVDLELKIIADKEVEIDFGTGALGVTPAHSMVDWQMAEENDLSVIKVINEDGNIHEGFGKYSGKTVLEAREMIVKKLKEDGLMEKEENIDNNLSLCYRCNTPIEPLPSLQWFIDVNKKIPKYKKSIKELSLEAVKKGVFGRDKINIVPERFEKIYYNWMENLRDWCISRQIWFGHQIPVWYKGDEIYVGVEKPKESGWQQDEDTLDTWFSSGLWTFSTLANNSEQIKIKDGKVFIDSDDFKTYHPTAVLETGYDILFFWVARMIIMTTYAIGDIPFQDVYLHGLIRAEDGRKMSKSLGNAIDPLETCKKYGTDATRLSLVIGTAPGNDMNLSEEKIAGLRNFTNKLWNISRYIITNHESRITNYEFDIKDLTLFDKWILFQLSNLITEINDDLDNYRFSQAAERLKKFTWDDLADWYLEVCKFEKNSSKNQILSLVLNDLLKLCHPFIPFVTEVIWKETKNKNLLLVEKYPLADSYKELRKKTNNGDFYLEVLTVQKIIMAIRNARSENKIEPGKKIKAVFYTKVEKYKELIENHAILIKGLKTGIKELDIELTGEKIDDAIFTTVGGIEIYLIGAMDKKIEAERIKKEIVNLEKIVKTVEVKLNNKEFVSKAPENVVKKEKEKLKKWKTELKSLKSN